MKKIGIMTMSSGANGLYGCNYGAALQGYALIEYLRSCGFEAWDLNYNSEYEYHPNQYSGLEKSKKRLQLLFNYKAVKGKLLSYKNKSGIQANKAAFDGFVRENNLTYSEGKFYSYQDLANVSSEFYAFITGSDVVWDPYNHQGQNDEGYFLNFCDQGVRRIAYAPSIGVTSLPDTAERNLKELLIQFDALSIREKSGAELIKNVTGLSVPVVLDPTLLVDRHAYDKIKRRKISLPDQYIAVYKFGEIEYTDEMVRLISERLNLPVVLIPSRYDSKFKTYWDIGLGEFIEVIKNARLV
ncbi:MAG: polysaccharide pyruvyl transferase family protein [Oscillospiraceae bacterium]|nr:polysaccharide pyruvyl transferase family protein [Oscillospiraceae bacterium]